MGRWYNFHEVGCHLGNVVTMDSVSGDVSTMPENECRFGRHPGNVDEVTLSSRKEDVDPNGSGNVQWK